MNPAPEQIAEFFKGWIPRYNFAITLDDDACWVDPTTNQRVRKNHIVCLMKNDLVAAFPSMNPALARKLAEKTAANIERRMTDKIKQGRGSLVDVSDSFI